MGKRIAVSALIFVLCLWSAAYAFEGGRRSGAGKKGSRQALLAQLPADKEALFRETMREAREKTSAMRTEIKALREEIKDILTAERFDEDLFREKTNGLETLRGKMRATMGEAVIVLARQFAPDERKILVELLPGRSGHGRPGSERKFQ